MLFRMTYRHCTIKTVWLNLRTNDSDTVYWPWETEYVKDAAATLKYHLPVTGSVAIVIRCAAVARTTALVQMVTEQANYSHNVQKYILLTACLKTICIDFMHFYPKQHKGYFDL